MLRFSESEPSGLLGRDVVTMLDLLYLSIAVGFFGLAAIYVYGLKRLQPEADDE